MTPSLWRELAVYAASFTIVAACLCQLDGKTRIAITLAIIGGAVFIGGLTVQALGIA